MRSLSVRSLVTRPNATGDPAHRAAGRHADKAWPAMLAGAVLLVIGAFLSWSYDPDVLGNLSLTGNPGGIQVLAILLGVVAVLLLLAERGPLRAAGTWVDTDLGLRALGTWTLVYLAGVLVAIAAQAGGLVNIDPGGWVSFAGASVLFGASRLAVARELRPVSASTLPHWAEIVVIVVVMGAALFGAAYALNRDDGWSFVLFGIFVGALVATAARSGFLGWFGLIAVRNRQVLTLAAFVVAFLFPFTQNGSDANMSIATQVLIFAATALGLNIVVGLAGLLDLGYIAFLGSGAYVAATLSTSTFATIGWKPPFLVVVLVGGCVSVRRRCASPATISPSSPSPSERSSG